MNQRCTNIAARRALYADKVGMQAKFTTCWVIQYFAPLKLFLYHDAMTTKQRFRNKYRLQLREKYHEPMQVHLVGGILMLKGASKNPIF